MVVAPNISYNQRFLDVDARMAKVPSWNLKLRFLQENETKCQL